MSKMEQIIKNKKDIILKEVKINDLKKYSQSNSSNNSIAFFSSSFIYSSPLIYHFSYILPNLLL